MGCFTLTGLIKNCPGLSGLYAIYMCDVDNIENITVNEDAGIVTAITMAPDKKFVRYYVFPQSSSLTVEGSGDGETGTYKHSATVKAKFRRISPELFSELRKLVAADIAVIVEDNNGLCHFIGADSPAYASYSGGSGEKHGEFAGVEVTISYTGKYTPLSISKTIVTQIT